MSDDKKTFLVKIIPPSGYSVYRLAFTRRHLAIAGMALLASSLTLVGVHSWQLHTAEANVRALQTLTKAQQNKLKTIDKQADQLANQLKAVQRENAEIKALIGADRGTKNQHVYMPPATNGPRDDFAGVQLRLRDLARAESATRADAVRMRRVAMHVLNLHRMESMARERMIAAIPSLNPVGGAIAAGFGWRTNPWPEFHKGVDLEANYGDPVRAAAAGTVASASWDGGYGLKVDIDHGNGYHTWYAHLSRVAVTPGERVTKGAPIAYVGSTGESTGPHLHYQVMYQGSAIDPAPFLNGVPERVLATLPDSSGV